MSLDEDIASHLLHNYCAFLCALIFQHIGETFTAYTIETSGISCTSFSVSMNFILGWKCTCRAPTMLYRDKVQPARKFRDANVKATSRNFCWWTRHFYDWNFSLLRIIFALQKKATRKTGACRIFHETRTSLSRYYTSKPPSSSYRRLS